MSIVSFLEQLARTAHHRVNLNDLLKEEDVELRKVFINHNASSLKTLLNDNTMPADRTTIFDI